ncbi:heme ABC transporter permease CcmC [Suttonella sp. R2A3]|uniref:heme ABC transporter permease CcmC n=1 Tax=Suttonella sp. R2A3 TaxID=2908648 RepID=UPI0038FD2D35
MWQSIRKWGHQWASPAGFDRLSGYFLPWLTPLAWILLAVGVIWGLTIAPADYQQGNSYRIIFIHVPSAALSMSIYVMMALTSLVFFIWRVRTAAIFARAAAPYGALVTALALISGMLWGKPTWGTYWTWDARLTSELILLFLYIAYMMLQESIEDRAQADRLSAILAIVGVINIPIIHYSVDWWNSLHQGATILKLGAPSMSLSMLLPLLITLSAFYLLFFSYILKSMQNAILSHRIERLLVRS